MVERRGGPPGVRDKKQLLTSLRNEEAMPGVPGMQQATRRKPVSGADSRTKIPLVCDLPVPPLPPGCTFDEHQAARWEELFSSAVAWLWGEAELGLVAAYIHLETQLYNGTATAATIREIKSLADQLGMTPAARARMGVEITDGDD